MDLTAAATTLVSRFLARHAEEAVAGGGAAAGAAPALSRRAVRGHRRGRVAPDQGAAALVRRARRHGLPDLAHPRNRRAALDPHRRHRRRPDRRAGADRRRPRRARTARARSKSCSSSWSAASARPPTSTGCRRMGRIFRAFLWMRWRVLVNSLERTGSRDTLERFSVAAGKLGPIVAMILLIPSSIALFVLGITAGFGIAHRVDDAAAVSASLLDVPGGRAHAARPGRAADARRRQRDPHAAAADSANRALHGAGGRRAGRSRGSRCWSRRVLGVAIGMAVGPAARPARSWRCRPASAFLLFLLGVASLASSVIHLLLRDRRRGDLVMLVAGAAAADDARSRRSS